jgi:fumarate hydratase subunit beta
VIKINLDTDSAVLREQKAGTTLLLSGTIYSARDAAHKRIQNLLEQGEDLPITLKDKVIYYMGPTPTKPGKAIGSCGPTSSYRMDGFLEMTLQNGVAATIGKGTRDANVARLAKEYKAPYLLAVGGAGAYLAQCVTSSKILAFEDLGTEAVRELIIKDFPVIVGIDKNGECAFF